MGSADSRQSGPLGPTTRERLWYAAGIGILAVVYFAAARLGLSLAIAHKAVSMVWPPTGVALAAVLLWGYRAWPGVALGAFLINASTGVGLATAGGIAIGNTLEALTGAYLLHHVIGFRHSLDRLRDVLGLVALGAGLSTTVSATIGVLSLCLGGSASWAAFGSLWSQWWFGDAMGALVVAPVPLTLWRHAPSRWRPRKVAEAAVLLVLLAASSQIAFHGWLTGGTLRFPLAFAIFPFVIWAALRFGPAGAATATALVSAESVLSTSRHIGPFVEATLTESLLLLQIFMSVVAVTALVLGAAMTQRRRVEEALQDREAGLRLILHQVPAIIWTTDTNLRITFIQGAGLTTARLEPREVVGTSVLAFVRGDPEAPAMIAHRQALQGQASSYEANFQEGVFQAHVEPLRAADGTILGCLGIALDITERKQAEAASVEANRQLAGFVRELAERNRQVTLVNEMSDLLQSCRAEREVYAIVAQFAERLFPAASGMLAALGPTGSRVAVVATWGTSMQSERAFRPDDCWAIRRGRVHLALGPHSGPRCQHVSAPPDTACLCVPLMAQGAPLGVLHLQGRAARSRQSDLDPEGLSDSQQSLAVSLAEHATLALTNLKLQERLRSEAIRDPLTGVFNRRFMEEWLERELFRAARVGSSVGIIILDIDHFKQFNDTFGHQAGDAVLGALGSFLRTHIRGGDVVCRYGGEEFTLIMPDASPEIARERAEQVREAVKYLRVPYRDALLGPVTISLGVAAFPDHGSTWQAVLQAADTALYRVKHNGRDGVLVAQ